MLFIQKLAITCVFLVFSIAGYTSDYYWVGGSGNWSDINHWATSSGGTTHHIQTPTAADNVIFDTNSMNNSAVINLNISTLFCKNFDVELITSNLDFIGSCQIWKIYGDFKLSNLLSLPTAKLYFEAPAGISEIKPHGLNFSSPLFFKGGGSWILSSSLYFNSISFENGTFNSNGKSIQGNSFTSNSSLNRNLIITNSSLQIGNWTVNGNGFHVNATNSNISISNQSFNHTTNNSLTYNNVYFTGAIGELSNPSVPINFHKVIFSGGGIINGNNTYDSLLFSKGQQYTLAVNTTQTIQHAFIANGSCNNKLSIQGGGSFASINKVSGVINCNYLILKHIHATGGAVFNAMATDDLGDNTGWNLLPPNARTLYWVDGNGDWDDTLHWASISGGAGGECIPTLVDNVIIDSNSTANLSLIISGNIPAECHNILWHDNVAGTWDFNKDIHISGSLYLGNSLQMQNTSTIFFVSDNTGETIHTSNINLKHNIEFIGLGSWVLTDSLINPNKRIKFSKGHLITDGNYINCNSLQINSSFTKILDLSSSVIDIQLGCNIQQDSLIIHPGTSHIHMLNNGSHFESSGNLPDSLYNLTFNESANLSSFICASTFFNRINYLADVSLSGIAISDTSYFKAGHSFTFFARTDTINKALLADGSCTKTINLLESTGISYFILSLPASATIVANNVSLRGSNAVGGASFIANNSSDLGENSGWTFNNNAQDHYWVNGNGNWQDSTHWSYSSGGSSGACIPKIVDNVYFDANSFNNSNDSVLIQYNDIFCHNMDWTGSTQYPLFIFDSIQYSHYISGSIKLINNMDFQMKAKTFYINDQLNKSIDMAGQIYDGEIVFCDTGQWYLLDTLYVREKIYHHAGKLICNQEPIFAQSYLADIDKKKTLDFHNGEINIIDGGTNRIFYWRSNNNTHLLAANSSLNFIHGGKLKTKGSNQAVFNNVNFLDSSRQGIIKHDHNLSNRFNTLFFSGDGDLNANNYMDTLIFSKGGTYSLQSNSNQYINYDWQANADCYGTIKIQGYGSATNVHKLNGNVNLSSVYLQNIIGIGNGSFTIVNGFDLGGNSSNWQITPPAARTLYWVDTTGEWWDTAHWSLTDGGISGECIPTSVDDVHFTQQSFPVAGSAISNLPIECHTMYWDFTPSNPYMNIYKLNIYGSLYLGDTMTLRSDVQFHFMALDTGNYIRSSQQYTNMIYFQRKGSWKLFDDLHCNTIFHNKGNFILNNNTVFAYDYLSPNNTPRKLDLRNSIFHLKHTFSINSDSINLMANNSQIIFNEYSNNPQLELHLKGTKILHFNNVDFKPIRKGLSKIINENSSHDTFNKVQINNNADIYGEHYFDSLLFQAGNTYQLEEAKTQTVGSFWQVRGNNCFALTLQSTSRGNQAYVSKAAGNVNGDFINMRDIHALGGANYYAGAFSSDISNNSAWIFSNGPQYVYGLGPDTNLSLGGNIILSSVNFNGGPNTSYHWSTGSTSADISVNQTGWYYITVDYAGNCTVYDSLYVGCNINLNYLITDNQCFNDSNGSIQIINTDTIYSYIYQWSNQQTGQVITNLAAGNYTLTVSADSGLCQIQDTISISQPPPIIIAFKDTAFCIGDSVKINLGNYLAYRWNDHYNLSQRWVNMPNIFIVQVKDSSNCWSAKDTITVRQDLPPLVTLHPDTTICIGGNVLLNAGSGYEAYRWNTNATDSSITVYRPGIYWVRVKERNCYAYDTTHILNCKSKFKVPNVFTPNGDGYNDVFEIEYQNIETFEIRIYNRWGMLVYHSTNLDKPWDGSINGEKATEGVYFWEINYTVFGETDKNPSIYLKGTVSLYRN